MLRTIASLAAASLALGACGQNAPATTEAQSQPGTSVQQGTATTGEAIAALGLTERQLLDADLLDAAGNEIGDVEGLGRNASGQVDRLLIEVEDSSPDRYVYVPLDGLTVLQRGDDVDISSSLTQQQLAAMPAVDRNAR